MKSTLLFIGSALAFASSLLAVPNEKPNVLFIVSDDLRTWLGCYGDEQAHTPNLDRLAKRGMVFMDAYCGAPLCDPTRTSLMTGMRPSVAGVCDNDDKWTEVLPDAMTIPFLFKQNSYYFAGLGKNLTQSHPAKSY